MESNNYNNKHTLNIDLDKGQVNTSGSINPHSNTHGLTSHNTDINNNPTSTFNVPRDITNQEFKKQPFEEYDYNNSTDKHNNLDSNQNHNLHNNVGMENNALNNNIDIPIHNNTINSTHGIKYNIGLNNAQSHRDYNNNGFNNNNLNNNLADTVSADNNNNNNKYTGGIENQHHISFTGENKYLDEDIENKERHLNSNTHGYNDKLNNDTHQHNYPKVIDTHYPDTNKATHTSHNNNLNDTNLSNKNLKGTNHLTHSKGSAFIPSAAIAGTGTAVSSANPLIVGDTTYYHENDLSKIKHKEDYNNATNLAANDPAHVGTKPDDIAKANPLNNNNSVYENKTNNLTSNTPMHVTEPYVNHDKHVVNNHNTHNASGGHKDKIKGKVKKVLGKVLHNENMQQQGNQLIDEGNAKIEAKNAKIVH